MQHRLALHHFGRPRNRVDKEQLEYLVESNFRISDIAVMFDCSRHAIERQMKELCLSKYIPLSDEDLDMHVRDIIQIHPQCGEKSVCSRLISYGIRIQRYKVRESL